MEERSIFDEPNRPYHMQQPLQNATAVLVLGIMSIVICGLGVVLGIIAMVLANKDMKLYNANPEIYTAGSLSNLKAGKTCAVIGIILSSLIIIVYAGMFFFIFYAAGKNGWH